MLSYSFCGKYDGKFHTRQFFLCETSYDMKIMLLPTNFANVSYLNLESACYEWSDESIIKDRITSDPGISIVHYRRSDRTLLKYDFPWEYRFIRLEYYKFRRRVNPKEHPAFPSVQLKYFRKISSELEPLYDAVIVAKLRKSWNENTLWRYVNHLSHQTEKRDSVIFQKIYEEIVFFIREQCSNSILIVNFFKAISILGFAEWFFDYDDACISSLKFFLAHATDISFRLWMALLPPTNTGLRNSLSIWHFSPTERAVLDDNQTYFQMLLEYGFPFALSEQSKSMHTFEIRSSIWPRFETSPDAISEETDDSALCTYYSPLFLVQLTWLICKIVEQAIKGDEATKTRQFLYISLIWKSIPSPYVPVEDMKIIFRRLNSPLKPDDEIQKVCDAYQEFFPIESSSGYEPRSLKHLCRWTIRQNSLFPNGISSLALPKKLQTYLKLEEDRNVQAVNCKFHFLETNDTFQVMQLDNPPRDPLLFERRLFWSL